MNHARPVNGFEMARSEFIFEVQRRGSCREIVAYLLTGCGHHWLGHQLLPMSNCSRTDWLAKPSQRAAVQSSKIDMSGTGSFSFGCNTLKVNRMIVGYGFLTDRS